MKRGRQIIKSQLLYGFHLLYTRKYIKCGKKKVCRMSNRNIGRAIMDQNYFEKWKECSEKWNTLFNEANNLGCKLYDDKDMDLNHWHQMDLIQINLLWLKSLLIYEHALSFIEQDISDDERFEVAKIHYHVTEIEKLNIDCILNIMGPLSRPRSKILRVAVSRIILSSEASKVKLVGNLVA